MNKKILIITYYWFPSGGGTGVHRISNFVKYLKRRGWEPVILTATSSEGQFDEEFSAPAFEGLKIIRTRAYEPSGLFRRFIGHRKKKPINPSLFLDQNRSWKVRFSAWIRLNFFLPDAKIFWRRPAVKEGKKIIASENPGLILTTCPPPTSHLIGKELARWSGLPWVADFRDPWTRIFYYDKAAINPISRHYNEQLEASVLEQADKVIVVNSGFFPHHPVQTVKIPNGFDPDDRKHINPTHRNDKFTLRYFGNFKANQYCPALFDALEVLSKNSEWQDKCRLEVYGFMDSVVRERFESPGINLEKKVLPFISKHKALLKMSESDLLLMVIGKGALSKTGLSTKLFDYLLASKPVLAFGPTDGAAAEVLNSTKTGKMFNFDETSPVSDYLKNHFGLWKKGETRFEPDPEAIENYNFKNLSERLEEQLLKVMD